MSAPKIYAVGETVFDIIFKNYSPQAAKPGGSAFNAIISLGRLGIPVQFFSEVGSDRIGQYILKFLRENGVETEHVIQFEEGKSALSLAFLNDSSDAEYMFYKDYPSQRLNKKIPVFTGQDYLLFGSFYGLNPLLRTQIEGLLNAAAQSNTLVFYDPNFRSGHLNDLAQLKLIIEKNFAAADIIRASDEDLYNIYGVQTPEEAWERISSFCNCMVYTANKNGIHLFTSHYKLYIEVDPIEPVSTIGAGDTFNAGILFGLYKHKITAESLIRTGVDEWTTMLKTAALFSKEVCLSYDNYISKEYATKYL